MWTPRELPNGWRVQKVENCTFWLAPETPDIKVKYTRRAKGCYTSCSDGRKLDLAYLKWYYADDKTLQEVAGDFNMKIIKDTETGKPRLVTFSYARVYAVPRLKRKGSVKTYTVEIPHWDFDKTAHEIRQPVEYESRVVC